MTSWKSQNYGDSKNIGDSTVLMEAVVQGKQSTEKFKGSKNALHDTTIVDKYHDTFVPNLQNVNHQE